jgi:peptidoglycan/LPS O-acetylase OafA/YrhL
LRHPVRLPAAATGHGSKWNRVKLDGCLTRSGIVERRTSRNPMERDNNFDCLRIVAALMVMFTHSFLVSYGYTINVEPLSVLTDGQMTSGTVGVQIFFAISGYLITDSWMRNPEWRRFLVARSLRIFPGLLGVLMVSVFVLGPLATSLPLNQYFGTYETWRYLGNIWLVGIVHELPGVFLNNPFKAIVNGSIWTLPYEFFCYLGVMALGLVRCISVSVVGVLLAISLALVSPIRDDGGLAFHAMFLAGMALRILRVPHSWLLVAVCVGILIVGTQFHVLRLVFNVFGTYLVLFVATHPRIRLPRAARYGDFSYGIYLYAYPFQQFIVWWFGALTWWQVFAISTPITVLAAVLSWHGIEKHALKLKPRRQSPVPA